MLNPKSTMIRSEAGGDARGVIPLLHWRRTSTWTETRGPSGWRLTPEVGCQQRTRGQAAGVVVARRRRFPRGAVAGLVFSSSPGGGAVGRPDPPPRRRRSSVDRLRGMAQRALPRTRVRRTRRAGAPRVPAASRSGGRPSRGLSPLADHGPASRLAASLSGQRGCSCWPCRWARWPSRSFRPCCRPSSWTTS